MNAPPKTPLGGIGATRYIGRRVPRKEDGRLLTGRGTFVDDVAVPGTLHCAFVRSSVARGTIRSLDASAARAMGGVHAVFTAEEIDRIPVTLLSFFLAPMEVETPLLARGRVAHVGEPIALIVARDRYVAEDAAGLVAVEYDEEDPVVTLADITLHREKWSIAAVYLPAQVIGCIAGAILANLMFAEPAVAWSTTQRSGWPLLLGEVVATAGLIAVIFALVRTGRSHLAAPAVGAYIGAAYFFTSSSSFANPVRSRSNVLMAATAAALAQTARTTPARSPAPRYRRGQDDDDRMRERCTRTAPSPRSGP